MGKFKWQVAIAGEIVGEVFADAPDLAWDEIEKWLRNLSVGLPTSSGYWKRDEWEVKRLQSGDIAHSLFTLRVALCTEEGKYMCCRDYELLKKKEKTHEQKLLHLIERLAKSGEDIAEKIEKYLSKET